MLGKKPGFTSAVGEQVRHTGLLVYFLLQVLNGDWGGGGRLCFEAWFPGRTQIWLVWSNHRPNAPCSEESFIHHSKRRTNPHVCTHTMPRLEVGGDEGVFSRTVVCLYDSSFSQEGLLNFPAFLNLWIEPEKKHNHETWFSVISDLLGTDTGVL